MILANFLILGTAKAGTTSIYHYLHQHPQVFMSVPKEPKFLGYEGAQLNFAGPGDLEYNRLTVTKLEAYGALFANASPKHKALGEASAIYLYLPQAVEGISKYIPRAQMFAILRNPVDRAYSSYLHLRRQAREPFTVFLQALGEEQERIRKNYHPLWHYKSLGMYSSQVKRYFDKFGRQQVHVYLYEDLKSNPLGLIREIFEILQIDPSFVPDMSEKYYSARLPKNSRLQKLLGHARKGKRALNRFMPEALRWRITAGIEALEERNWVSPPALSPEVRQTLAGEFREDILRLQDLLQRDLTAWLTQDKASEVPAAVSVS